MRIWNKKWYLGLLFHCFQLDCYVIYLFHKFCGLHYKISSDFWPHYFDVITLPGFTDTVFGNLHLNLSWIFSWFMSICFHFNVLLPWQLFLSLVFKLLLCLCSLESWEKPSSSISVINYFWFLPGFIPVTFLYTWYIQKASFSGVGLYQWCNVRCKVFSFP